MSSASLLRSARRTATHTPPPIPITWSQRSNAGTARETHDPARLERPKYLVGAEYPHWVDARCLLERIVADDHRLVTDAEVLQEILRRYLVINRRDAIQLCVSVVLEVIDEVLPVTVETMSEARDIVTGHPPRPHGIPYARRSCVSTEWIRASASTGTSACAPGSPGCSETRRCSSRLARSSLCHLSQPW